jgi:hypothetical protein
MLLIRYDDGRIEVSDTGPHGRPRWAAAIQLTPDLKLTLVDCRLAAPTEVFVPEPPRPYSIHILKSNLQKCVRRADYQRALVTGWHMLCQDPVETLRRLPVIIAEDSLVQPRLYVELVWLMAAVSKGYRLTWTDAAVVMAALANALRTPTRVAIYAEPRDTAAITDPVAVALMIRAEFGGMEHDRNFLLRLAARAALEDLPLDSSEPDWIETDIDPLEPRAHILLEAIDQHCCRYVLRDVPAVHPQAIWWCRSSLNVRPLTGTGATDGAAIAAAKRAEHQANLDAARPALDAFARRQIACGWVHAATGATKAAAKKTATGPLDAWLKQKT